MKVFYIIYENNGECLQSIAAKDSLTAMKKFYREIGNYYITQVIPAKM